jgi:hypothetical protein
MSLAFGVLQCKEESFHISILDITRKEFLAPPPFFQTNNVILFVLRFLSVHLSQ